MRERLKLTPFVAALALGACNPTHEPGVQSGIPTEAVCSERGLSTEEYADQIIVTAEQAARAEGGNANIGPLMSDCSPEAIDRAWSKVHQRPESDFQWEVEQVINRGSASEGALPPEESLHYEDDIPA